MNVLIIGGGGREHALAWKLRQSRVVTKVWCAPGNGGISQDAECLPANLADISGLADLAEKLGANLTVVGPEQPLVGGVVDEFDRRHLRIIGPSRSSARLEGSKVFAKEFLDRHNIPTARIYGVYDDEANAARRLQGLNYPVVLKAEGLCGGKGVLVAKSSNEAADFVERTLGRKELGEGGSRLLIEEALEGKELSFIVLCDGEHFLPFVPTRDHKRVFDNDLGLNTGGMGAYSCDGIISIPMEEQIRERIVEPTLAALARDASPYRGFLYFGLMLTASGAKVLEFNCRLGDPETQAIVARMDFDLCELLLAADEAGLKDQKVAWHPGASVCVVVASGGYPGKFEAGKEIRGLDAAAAVPGVCVFHAGTRSDGALYYTSSGRVLGITATGSSLAGARQTAYEGVRQIQFSECHYRSDIASAGCRTANVGED